MSEKRSHTIGGRLILAATPCALEEKVVQCSPWPENGAWAMAFAGPRCPKMYLWSKAPWSYLESRKAFDQTRTYHHSASLHSSSSRLLFWWLFDVLVYSGADRITLLFHTIVALRHLYYVRVRL